MDYQLLKVIHIISSTVLFGLGWGSAFYKYRADQEGDLRAMIFANRNVVLADWIFIAPSVIIQPITGVLMMRIAGYRFTESWIFLTLGLYILAGLCWIGAVYLQIRMRNLTTDASRNGTPLPPVYNRFARIWFWLGVGGFLSVVVIFFLMVFKPGMRL